jgi:hypothetical protein
MPANFCLIRTQPFSVLSLMTLQKMCDHLTPERKQFSCPIRQAPKSNLIDSLAAV